MGKVALLIVLAAGVAGATIMFSSQETDIRSAKVQGEYEADVIAREIARSAYNSGSADIHRYGTDIDAALTAFGTAATGCANGKATCVRRTGEMLDGTYIVEASYDGGNGVDIYVKGMFSYNAGGDLVEADHEINESQSVGVLRVSEGGLLRIQFVDSWAGYCSAVFLKRTLPGVADEDQPLPEMVYAPGKNRNGARNIGLEVELDPGTQMNFAIGVDNNCGGNGTRPNSHAALRYKSAQELAATSDPEGLDPLYGRNLLAAEMASYRFRESDWAWVHWALDASTVSLDDPVEGPWAMVETDRNNNQRWRIAFEDIHNWNLAPDHRDYHNPNKSLWATKKYGYDWSGNYKNVGNDGVGNGWTDNVQTLIVADDPNDPLSDYTVRDVAGSDGFHDLRDTGSPADFSDQVIMIEIVPAHLASSSGDCNNGNTRGAGNNGNGCGNGNGGS